MSTMSDNVLDNPRTWNPGDIGQFRFERFTKLGFGPELAGFLAESKIDLNRVGKLIAKGATHMQAVRIEAGRDWIEDDPTFDHAGFDRLMQASTVKDDAPPLDPKKRILDFIE